MTVRIIAYTDQQIYSRPSVVDRLKKLTNEAEGISSAFLIDLNQQRPGIFLLAWSCNTIVGWAMISDRFHGNAKQVGCYVHPLYRRQRIGLKLVLRAKKYCEQFGWALYSAPWNSASKNFYKKSCIPENTWIYPDDQEAIQEYYSKRTLTSYMEHKDQ